MKPGTVHSRLSEPWLQSLLYGAVACGAFHMVFAGRFVWVSVVLFFLALAMLVRVPHRTERGGFVVGLLLGVSMYAPQLGFFWVLFGPAAIVLWLVLAFWLGLFCWVSWELRVRVGPVAFAVLAAVLWTGFEYFRSELYFLRFSWLKPVDGMVLGSAPVAAILGLGGYGVGFLLLGGCGLVCVLLGRGGEGGGSRASWLALGVLWGLGSLGWMQRLRQQREGEGARAEARELVVAGLQLELPGPAELRMGLDRLAREHPEAGLVILSEYSVDGEVPEYLKSWCVKHRRYLVVGGKEPGADGTFYNTAFVVGPQGLVVFRQAKSVPIQFFADGLPAARQALWESPWGRIGICICYDLSFTRVTDRLVALGAEALVVPTMDMEEWGRRQHDLHALVAPIRAREYGIPLLRVASSGISQFVDRNGEVAASAPFPGQGAVLSARVTLVGPGRLPWDRWLAPVCSGVAVLLTGWVTWMKRGRLPRLEMSA